MLQYKHMRYGKYSTILIFGLFTALIFNSVLSTSVLADVSVNDIAALKYQYEVKENSTTPGAPATVTIKNPIFANGSYTYSFATSSSAQNVPLKCGNTQINALLLVNSDTWQRSLNNGARPDSLKYGLTIGQNHIESIANQCPKLIDDLRAVMSDETIPEAVRVETEAQLDKALHIGAGDALMQKATQLNQFKDDSATWATWCSTSSQGASCSDEKWNELVGVCVVDARGKAADAARYERPTPSDEAIETSRKEFFSSCLSNKLYGNESRKSIIIKALGNASIIDAAAAGATAKANEAGKMLGAIQDEIDKQAGQGQETPKTCSSVMTGIGWIVCPAMTAAAGFADGVWLLFEQLLTTNPLSGDQSSAIFKTWGNFRNIANALLIVFFLFTIFSQMSGAGISNYGIKKVLPRIVIGAIFINLSFFVMQLSIDVANILGKTLDELITSQVSEIDPSKIGWEQLIADIVAGGLIFGAPAVAGVVAAATALPATGLAGLMFVLLLLIPGIIGIAAGIMALVFREALIPILAIISPVAILAWILPNTESWFQKWSKLFTSLLFLYPLAALYYGALKFFSLTILNDPSSGTFQRLMAISLLFIGTFVVLIIAIKSNSIVGGMMKGISNVANKAIAPARKLGMGVAGGMAALNFAQFKNQDFGAVKNRHKLNPLRYTSKITRAGGGILQNFDQNKIARETALDNAKTDATEAYQKRLIGDYDGVDTTKINEFALKAAGGDRDKAKVMLDRLIATQKSENLKKSMATLTTDFAREKAAGNNTDEFLEKRVLTATSDSDRDAALHMASQTGRSQVLRKIQNNNAYSTSPELRLATQEAISANVSSLIGKAPDLVKGSGPAFNNITAEQLAGFDESTGKAYMDYLAGMPETHNDPTEQAKLVAAKTRAIQSYINASEGIKKDVKLQNTFNSNTGNAIREALSSNPSTAGHAQLSQLDSYIRSSMDGSGNIR